MNAGKFTQRICQILIVILLIAIVIRFFVPVLRRQRALRAREAEVRMDIQREAEQLRLLKWKQEKLQEDPIFIEKTAREELGYAKPGETIFRFVDEGEP